MNLKKITIALFFIYIIWEIYVYNWAKTEATPIIRVDLIIIYSFFLILIILYFILSK